MTSNAAMEVELASVLADAAFVRSPVLARLLGYLVQMTLSGDASRLKSYSVAVDGLGRSPDLDPQVDTYARVQVARLRKALDTFYASGGAGREQRLTIDSGSYEVKLVANVRPCTAGGSGVVSRFAAFLQARKGMLIAAGLLGGLVFAIALTLHWQDQARADQARWRFGRFPSATVTVKDHLAGRSSEGTADLIRQELLMRIGRYQGIGVNYENSANSDYAIKIDLYPAGKALQANTLVVDRRANRLAWSSSDTIQIDTDDIHSPVNSYVARTAFTIARANGVIHSNERQRGRKPDTPYGCWLRFTVQLRNNHVIDDPVLSECAEAWHEAIPDHPLAAGLYAWTLVDRSIVEIGDSDRRELLDEALQTLESARALNPSSGFVPAVAMRAYAIADEDLAMRGAADQALKLNPGNLEIEGLAGTMLTFRNDPRGEGLVDDAIAQHPDPPPWYFVAKFVAAMMREDTAAAGRALTQLRQLKHTLPVLPVFSAAYEARTGRLAAARASWERAKGAQPILRIDPDIFFDRSPLGPAVVTRLKRWLGPVL